MKNAQQNTNAQQNIEEIIAQTLQAQAQAPVKVAKQPAGFNIKTCSFKSIATSFGKMWAYKGRVSLLTDNNPADKTYLTRLTQGMLTDVPDKGHQHYATYKRIKQNTLDMFATKSYALTAEKHNNLLAYMPAELCHDLQVLRNLGVKAKFELEVSENDDAVSLRYKKIVPKTQSTETDVTYGNIGTEATSVYVGDSKHPLFAKRK